MAFSDFRSYDQVIEKYNIENRKEDFLPLADAPVIDEHFRKEIKLNWFEFPYERSEAAASQALVFPILREVWKTYRENLLLLSQEPLRYDDDLSGVADFSVSKKARVGITTPEGPFLLVGEAKHDEFYRGWGQALAAMYAVHKRDGQFARTIFGIATNGRIWEFGKLENGVFVLDTRRFSPSDLDTLFSALHYVFAAQVQNLPAPPAAA